ncbi:hypothetical protein [Leucothrix pacifica]|uniref:LysM domain-containing protein n=1 Tax=Leucothrix pacifica TaxID=1247513 RepID=A0A317C2A8_9GAMM|nr:hypothetical protein [Leucothrix pacifica]PWQ92321.1 hypothetical protein DKW60_21775 [Leucothrix pacifica]
MGTTRLGALNAVTSTILLMLLLFAGLYYVAHNPGMVGFDVQAASFGDKLKQSTQADDYFTSRASLINGRETVVDTSVNTSANSRPQCQQWYKTRKGDTQWGLAQRHSTQSDKWPWIKGMRWVSGKNAQDDALKSGEVVCVDWAS